MKKEYIKPTAKVNTYLSEIMQTNIVAASQGMTGGELDSKSVGSGIDWNAFSSDED